MEVDAQSEGPLKWLLHAVVGLVATIFTFVTGATNKRVAALETKSDTGVSDVHKVELDVREQFRRHEREESTRFESHRSEVKQDFSDLHKKVNEGHKEILEKIGQLKGNCE